MKYYLALLAIFIIPLISYSQTRPLAIGDAVPDIAFSKMLNFGNTTTRISSFKGKLIIIYFWATWCSPCVSQLPKNDSLQKIFGGKVQFLSVSNERQSVVKNFLKRLADIKHINVSSLVEDNVFNEMFPHQYIPYFAWIDPNGKVIATTEENQINEKNISAMLANENTSMVNFNGEKTKLLNPRRPIFVNGIPLLKNRTDTIDQVELIPDSNIIFQSIVSKSIPGLPSRDSWSTIRFQSANASIVNLYQDYFGLFYKKLPFLFYNKSRYRIEIKDSILLNKLTTSAKGAKGLEWIKNHGYCYQLIWKNAKNWDEKVELLKEDLDRYFGKPLHITANLEKRMAPSDVLTLQANNKKLTTNGDSATEHHDKYSYVQHNLPLSQFIDILQTYFWQSSDRPVFNETNFTGNVDLEINCNMNDEHAVNDQLSKYGLQFKFGVNRMTDLMIIKKAEAIPK
jgi:thiol-disulfide isomerase/thioredoxin